MSHLQGRIQGGVLGVKTTNLFGNFFQFARVFRKTIPKPPPKFSLQYKNISTPPPSPLEKFLDTPLVTY